MFWANIYALSPHLDALLKKEDVSLQELMDQEDIVPECKSQNKILVDYLSRPEIMKELVTLTTKEPSTETDERSRYKYSNIACELLTCNVPSLNEKLAGDETLLAKLYSFLDTDEPLNPLLASFFSKTIGALLTRRSDQNWYSYQFMCFNVLEFTKSRENCVDRLLQHLETSAIMDLVLKLVTKVEGSDMRLNVLNWLDNEKLVQRVIKLLSPTVNSEKHANASQLLCDMIKLARYFRITCTERTDPDPILITLEKEDTVSLLFETILTGEPVESSIVGGIQVLLVLLGHETANIGNEEETQGNGTGEEITNKESRMKIQNATLPYLEPLQKLLLNPPPKPPVKTTAGLLTSPLGNTRLHVAKLLVALLYNENIGIFKRLAQLGTFQILLDLFFKYSWNNFLHTQVEQCLASVINSEWGENAETVYSHMIVECKLISRLLDAWNQNSNTQNKETNVRQGYMGHLIKIVRNIVKQCKKNEILDEYLKTNLSAECAKQWEELITTELTMISKTQELELGGKPQPYMSGSDDPNDEYNSYGQDAYVQQVYANYQGQSMTPNFIEHCGFHDDEFNDRDDALQLSNSIDQLTTIPFTVNEEDLDKGEDLFNKICQQKQKAGLDESGGAVEWGDEGELTFQTVIDKRDWPLKQQHQDSNSSDEDEDTREMNMEPDSTDPWGSSNDQFPSVLPRVNPWDVAPADPPEYAGGWANFDNFETTLNMEGLKISEPPNQVSELTSASSESPMIIESATSLEPLELTVTSESSTSINKIAEKILQLEETSVIEIVTIQEQSQKAQISHAPAKTQDTAVPSYWEIQKIPEQSTKDDGTTDEKTEDIEKALETAANIKKVPETIVNTEKSSVKCENIEKASEKSQSIDVVMKQGPNPVEKTSEKSSNEKSPDKQEKISENIPALETTIDSSSDVEPVVQTVPADSNKPDEPTKVEEPEKRDKPQTML
ncbi:serine/threonine-protein phosphatase 6 regulatory subunit 3 isoform X2 [Venturia canescens]|uniref:serine/threonine-protein phosphatase 6 regulatory subunit 3 isoform X2 n=1 Tax=Venturia canescens TaxID=32260 RepID=UPI001C9BBFF7|nr:serine/threonine-protein phosphatase 6 regulatory subunit 3 isoform X2 [Venturia canescens]